MPEAFSAPSVVLTVAELNREARRLLERQFPLLWVGGEVSNLTRAASGHVYFSLKDDQAQVRCVLFRLRAQRVPWRLENGQQVEIQALATLYEPRGEFQLTVEAVRRAGLGRLYELFLRLKEKLAAEGLFAPERKRAIPRHPRRVGIVTSPQAAALRDVIATFRRRAPHVELIVYPTLVQGAEAPAALVAALKTAYARNECDLLLVVRGGGSLEDLWAFNDEAVARTLAVSPAPTLTGVGHETDTTLVDFVADLRAPTPTAAAEIASVGWFEATGRLAVLADAMRRRMERALSLRAQALDRLTLRLVHPAQRLAAHRQRLELLARRLAAALRTQSARRQPLERLGHRLQQAMARQLAARRAALARQEAALAALSPLATLERGYGIVRGPDGALVRSAAQLAPGDALRVQFAAGSAEATVTATRL